MNLMEGLCAEIDRVKEIADEYESFPNGAFAAAFMRQDIKEAEEARNNGDTVKMIFYYQKLGEYQL